MKTCAYPFNKMLKNTDSKWLVLFRSQTLWLRSGWPMKSEEGGSFCSVFVISLLWVLLRDTSELYHEYMYNIPCEVAIILGFLQYILNEDYVCMHVCITSSFGEKISHCL